MRYKDEFHIASTAVLLSMAMFGISVVVPKESRVPTAKTTLTEAPETAAEQAEQAEFPIYSQDSNYDSSYDSSQNDTSYDSSQVDGRGTEFRTVSGRGNCFGRKSGKGKY